MDVFAETLKAEVSRLDDARVHRADRHFVRGLALERRHGLNILVGPQQFGFEAMDRRDTRRQRPIRLKRRCKRLKSLRRRIAAYTRHASVGKSPVRENARSARRQLRGEILKLQRRNRI